MEANKRSTKVNKSRDEKPLFTGKKVKSFQINENDVLCGRGKRVENWAGNCKYRDLIKKYRSEYLSAKPKCASKSHIAQMINSIVENSLPPGRFLKKSETEEDEWCEISTYAAREKTCQALREKKKKSASNPVQNPGDHSPSSTSELASPEKNSSSSGFQEHNQNTEQNIPFSIQVRSSDVLFDCNDQFQDHEGNQRFHLIVRSYEDDFFYATEERRRQISRLIVRGIQGTGRFLKLDSQWQNGFVEISLEEAQEKTSQILHENALKWDSSTRSHIAKLYLAIGTDISSPHLRTMNPSTPYIMSRKRQYMGIGRENKKSAMENVSEYFSAKGATQQASLLRAANGFPPAKKMRYF